jgi:UDPglucose 6-dehydrogenase
VDRDRPAHRRAGEGLGERVPQISFINAVAELCDATGADVTLAEALGHDKRIGHRFLNAGLGFGGGCLPKDLRAFIARAGEPGVQEVQYLLRQVDEINMSRRERTAEIAREMLGSVLGSNVAMLGCAFKPNSDDVRDSPALNVAAALQLRGAQVRVHDPEATENARTMFPTLEYTTDVLKACEQADLVLHLTEWAEYRELDPAGWPRSCGRTACSTPATSWTPPPGRPVGSCGA